MARGMLEGIFSPDFRNLRQEELDEEQRTQFLANDPFAAMAHTAYSGARMAGRGLGEAAARAAGVDPRTPLKRQSDAVQAAKAQVSQLGLDPDDPASMDQFYRQVITILQKQGLAAEALEVGKEYHAQKRQRTKDDLDVRKLERLERNDANLAAHRKAQNELALKRLGRMGPPVVQLLDRLNETTDPFARRNIIAAIEKATAGTVKAVDLGDRVQLIDAATGEPIREEDKGAAPMPEKEVVKAGAAENKANAAYSEAMAGLQRQYDAAVALHNHPGVEGITGRWGKWVGEDGMFPQLPTWLSGDDARSALALYKQVTGGAFLAGLSKLKSASSTGATGLGAVSEKEGDKVQSDAAALDRLQEAQDFRRQLATYIREMEGFADRLAAAAPGDKISPIPLQKKPLTNGRGGTVVRTGPPPGPSVPAAAPAGDVEEWVRVNGKLQRKAR